MADDSDEEVVDLFQEPEGFYKPEKEATFVKHRMLNGDELKLRLVGHNPLWVGLQGILHLRFFFFFMFFMFFSFSYYKLRVPVDFRN